MHTGQVIFSSRALGTVADEVIVKKKRWTADFLLCTC